jgi:hypothetical protein
VAEQIRRSGHALLVCVYKSRALAGSVKQQEIGNSLWAAASLHWYNRDLFTMGVSKMAELGPDILRAQPFSITLFAAAMCGHWDAGVQQLLGYLNRGTLQKFQNQHISNMTLSWAIFSCIAAMQGRDNSSGATASVLRDAGCALFIEAAARPASSYIEFARKQLLTAHWYANMLGLPGLPPGEVYEALSSVAHNFGDQVTSNWQRHAADILQQLSYTVGVEQMSQDGRMRADIVINALPNGNPCCIAVECDGPSHYIAEYRSKAEGGGVVFRLDGRTHLRNVLLRQSFPDGVVCIPGRLWASMQTDAQRQEYLQEVLFMEHMMHARQQVRCWLARRLSTCSYVRELLMTCLGYQCREENRRNAQLLSPCINTNCMCMHVFADPACMGAERGPAKQAARHTQEPRQPCTSRGIVFSAATGREPCWGRSHLSGA